MRNILLLLCIPLLNSCAGVGYAVDRATTAAQNLTSNYCSLPAGQRQIVRGLVNDALDRQSLVVIGCPSDKDFDQLYETYVAPYTDYDLKAAIVNTLLEEGHYTLPDGTTLRIIAE